MQIKKLEEKNIQGIKFTAQKNGREVGRAYLYVLKNDLHEEPFGILEDVFVEESQRGQGIGKALVRTVIEEAKARGCYKLICTSRSPKVDVHEFYKKLGFTDYGKEFRMDFN